MALPGVMVTVGGEYGHRSRYLSLVLAYAEQFVTPA